MSGVFGDRDIWIEMQDKDGNRLRILAKLDHVLAAIAAYEVYVERNPGEKIIVKQRSRVIRKSWEKD